MKILLFLMALITFNSQAEVIIRDLDQVNAKTLVENSSSVTLNYTFNRVFVDHVETSSTPEFTPYGEQSNIYQHQIELAYEKEFFAANSFSVSFLAGFGFNYGKDNGEETSPNNINASEELKGYQGGAGLSINYNITSGNYKYQPFISGRSLKANNTYFLRFDGKNFDRSVEIETREDLTVLETTAGIKIFNIANSMMSTIAVKNLNYKTDKLETNASMGSLDFDITKNAEFKRNTLALLLGMGFIF